MIKRIVSGVAAFSFLALAPAHAAPIPAESSFDLGGSLRVITMSTFDQATGFDFGVGTNPIAYGTPGGTVTLGGNVGAFYRMQGFATGMMGTVQDLTNLSVGAQSLPAFYSFTTNSGSTLQFDLSAITAIVRQAADPTLSIAPSINVYGRGILSLTGYDSAPGTFSFSTTNTGNGVSATFQSSISSPTTPVPEPATWALMVGGFGLIGSALRRRKAATVSFA